MRMPISAMALQGETCPAWPMAHEERVMDTTSRKQHTLTHLLLLLAHTVQNLSLKLSSGDCAGCAASSCVPSIPKEFVDGAGSIGGGGGGGGAGR